ncbi:MAG: hypothetical protein ACI8UC_000523 [Psychromonas sp.]|jgi:hypothetical protein
MGAAPVTESLLCLRFNNFRSESVNVRLVFIYSVKIEDVILSILMTHTMRLLHQ